MRYRSDASYTLADLHSILRRVVHEDVLEAAVHLGHTASIGDGAWKRAVDLKAKMSLNPGDRIKYLCSHISLSLLY